jgi:hypothetical protein
MPCSYRQIHLLTVTSLSMPTYRSAMSCLRLIRQGLTSQSPLIQCVSYVLVSCLCDSTGNNKDPQVITRAQERLFAGPKQKGVNVITMGYRGVCLFCVSQTRPHISISKSYQSSSKMRAGDTRSGVNNFFVNTNVTALQGSDWERLLRRFVLPPVKDFLFVTHARHWIRIGECAMFHLLTEASIFVPLPNECLCQLTGMPLVFRTSPAIGLANSALSAPENRKRKASPHSEVPTSKKRFQHTSGGFQ